MREIDLVEDDDLGKRVETGAVLLELAVDRSEALAHVLAHVDDVQQQPRTLEVREELVAQPHPFARAFDQPGNVGDGELAPLGRVDRPEHRGDRREGVVRDLWLRVRDAAKQRRLARVGEADQRRVGEQFQPQVERELLTGQARLGEARRLPRRRCEALVAAAGRAASCDDHARAGVRQVCEQLPVAVEDLRADGHAQLSVFTGRTVLQRAAAATTALRFEALIRPKARQIAQVRLRDEHDVAAGTAVPAVRTALGHVLLAAEREPAVTAAPRLHVDACAIVEHQQFTSNTI